MKNDNVDCLTLQACYQHARKILAEVDRLHGSNGYVLDEALEARARKAWHQFHKEVQLIHYREAVEYYGMPLLHPEQHRFAGSEMEYLEYCADYDWCLDIHRATSPPGGVKEIHARYQGDSDPTPMSKEMRQVYYILKHFSIGYPDGRYRPTKLWNSPTDTGPIAYVDILDKAMARVDIPLAEIDARIQAEADRKWQQTESLEKFWSKLSRPSAAK